MGALTLIESLASDMGSLIMNMPSFEVFFRTKRIVSTGEIRATTREASKRAGRIL